MSTYINFSSVFFSYENSQNILFENLNLSFSTGWCGISGANGTGKSTLFSLILGNIKPDSGLVSTRGEIAYCPQLHVPVSVEDYPYIYDYSKENCEYKRLLGLDDDMFLREHTLSGGEKKRLQLYVALSRRPDILLLDEPTNHLDQESKEHVLSALRHFDGIGLIISHDRRFVSELAERTILFFKQGWLRATLIEDYPLPLDKALEESDRIQEALLSERSNIQSRMEALKSTISGLERKIVAKKKLLSKKSIDRKDNDGRQKVDLARLSGKDRGIADRKMVLQGRRRNLENVIDSLSPRLKSKTGLDSYSFSRPYSDLTVESTSIAAGDYEIVLPDIVIRAGEHVALLGNNGTGKSLFMEKLYSLACLRYGKEKVLYIRQDYEEEDCMGILRSFEALSSDSRARVISDLYRLGSKAESFSDASASFSPGEMKKLSLVMGLQESISFLILDEPTNHLDVVAIRILEKLLERAEATLVVASHDLDFMDSCTSRRLLFQRNGNKGRAFFSLE